MLIFDEAVNAVVQDYKLNERDSTASVERRIKLHLAPTFAGVRMTAITKDMITDFAVKRQETGRIE